MSDFDTIHGLLAEQNQIAARLHGWATTASGREALRNAAAAIHANNGQIAECLQRIQSADRPPDEDLDDQVATSPGSREKHGPKKGAKPS